MFCAKAKVFCLEPNAEEAARAALSSSTIREYVKRFRNCEEAPIDRSALEHGRDGEWDSPRESLSQLGSLLEADLAPPHCPAVSEVMHVSRAARVSLSRLSLKPMFLTISEVDYNPFV
jgi:hypothetical protein